MSYTRCPKIQRQAELNVTFTRKTGKNLAHAVWKLWAFKPRALDKIYTELYSEISSNIELLSYTGCPKIQRQAE